MITSETDMTPNQLPTRQTLPRIFVAVKNHFKKLVTTVGGECFSFVRNEHCPSLFNCPEIGWNKNYPDLKKMATKKLLYST